MHKRVDESPWHQQQINQHGDQVCSHTTTTHVSSMQEESKQHTWQRKPLMHSFFRRETKCNRKLKTHGRLINMRNKFSWRWPMEDCQPHKQWWITHHQGMLPLPLSHMFWNQESFKHRTGKQNKMKYALSNHGHEQLIGKHGGIMPGVSSQVVVAEHK